MQPVMTPSALDAFIETEFPQVRGKFRVVRIAAYECEVEMQTDDSDLRPGGTVSGPSMFALVDVSFYFATLAMIGPKALTVTTHLSIDFMRKPKPGLVRACAKILKLGRSLSVGHVLVFAGGDEPVAQASVTYSIPPAG